MATEQVAEKVVEEVAQNLEEAAEATRRINPSSVGYFFVGVAVGSSLGFYFGYRFNREKIKAEEFARSQEEIEQMRLYYLAKEREEGIKIIPAAKPSAEEIVREQGYVTADQVDIPPRPLPAPVPVEEPRSSEPAVEIEPQEQLIRTEEGQKDKNQGWSYPAEMAKRSTERPHIIHQDEFMTNETGYSQVTYTYYEQDKILADEHDDVVNNVDQIVGERNLTKWGHGADDANILYVRNSKLEIEFELCRSPKSYEQEIMGLEHSDPSYERMHRRRDRNDEAD
jgi:hypothetical protein